VVKPAHADAAPIAESTRLAVLADFVSLTKPRLNGLVVATSAAGYYLAAPPRGPDLMPLALVGVGTALVAGGAAVLNQVYERDTDALMTRTRLRPLPDRRVTPADARAFGLVLSAAGLLVLGLSATLMATLLALTTLVVYLGIYTPMKRRTPHATLVGAVPGALPPLIGWTAGHGAVSAGGLALFAIVFFWQIPHFMAIAWMYRDDYLRAGLPILSVVDPSGRRVGRQALGYAAALVPASLMPWLLGLSGTRSAIVTLALGLGLLALAARFARAPSDRSAYGLFVGSIAHLPLSWVLLIADRV
jgi:protoheme IX farnesyltransferase